MIVYLAGGMRTDWQSKVTGGSIVDPNRSSWSCWFIDPRRNRADGTNLNPAEYTAWDLYGIRKCDILLANLEADNPAIGMAAEIGYAHALGKTILLVMPNEHKLYKIRYWDFIKQMADVTFTELDNAVDYLRILQRVGV